MSGAKKVVESTARRILVYTAEIIMSIILLIIICLPLAFTIPMWFQAVALGTPRSSVLLDPVVLFGPGMAFAILLTLCLFSMVIGYSSLQKLIPDSKSEKEEETEIEEEESIGEDGKEEEL